MSWGERDCEYFTGCQHNPTISTCNTECEHYEQDKRAFGDFYCDKEKDEIQRLRKELKKAKAKEA